MINVLDENSFDEAIKTDLVTVVDFYADWCGPCKALAPLLEEISNKYDNKFYKVNVDNNMALAKKYKIMSIPNVCFFRKGELVDRIIGSATEEEIISKLKS